MAKTVKFSEHTAKKLLADVAELKRRVGSVTSAGGRITRRPIYLVRPSGNIAEGDLGDCKVVRLIGSQDEFVQDANTIECYSVEALSPTDLCLAFHQPFGSWVAHKLVNNSFPNFPATVSAAAEPGQTGQIDIDGDTVDAINWSDCSAEIGDRAFAGLTPAGDYIFTLCKCCGDNGGGGGGSGTCERGIDFTTNSSVQSAQSHEVSVSFSKDTYYANDPQTTATVRFKLISGGSPPPETIDLQLVLDFPFFDVIAISDGGTNSAAPNIEPTINWNGITADYGVEYVRTVVFSQASSNFTTGDSETNKVYIRAPLYPPPSNLFGDCSHVATVVDCPAT